MSAAARLDTVQLMEPSEIIRQLSYVRRGRFPRAALAAAIAQREEITPLLLAELASTPSEILSRFEAAPGDKTCYFLHHFALLLLALFQEQSAFKPILRLLSAPTEKGAPDLFGDLVTEELPAILVRCYDGDLAALKGPVESTAPGAFVRHSALRAILGLMMTGRLSREEVVAYFEKLLETVHAAPVDEEDEFFKSWIVDAACELREERLRPLIERCFDADLVDTTVVARNDVDRDDARDFEHLRSDILREQEFADLIGELAKWSWFQKETAHERIGLRRAPWELRANSPIAEEIIIDEIVTGGFGISRHYNTETFVRGEAKTGRNDPCPCGSGKKYKKCCLDD